MSAPSQPPTTDPERGAPSDEPLEETAESDEGLGWFAWAVAVMAGVGPGLAAWALTRPDPAAWLMHNQLPTGSRSAGIGWALVSLVVVGVLGRVLHRRGWSPRRLLRTAALPATAPLWALLFVPQLEGDAPRLTIGVVLAVAVTSGVAVSAIFGPLVDRWAWAGGRPWVRRLPAGLVALGTLAMAAALRHLAFVRHYDLGSRNFDLGIFDNLLYHASLGHWQVTTFLRGDSFTSAHVTPTMQLLGPLYWFAPGPETLMAFQVVWLASGAIPAYRLAVHVLGGDAPARWVGMSLAFAYLMHPSMHGSALFDAHALVLAAPLVLWVLDSMAREKWRRYWILVVLLVFVREDVPFVVMGLGLHAALSARQRRVGVLTIGIAVVGLLVMKLGLMAHPDLFMPDTESTYRYTNRFSEVIPDPKTGGASDILVTLAGNPGFVIQHALSYSKLTHLAVLALPCLGLCFMHRRAWLPMSFGLVFTLLGSGAALRNPYLHYTVFLFPVMIAAAAEGARVMLRRWERRTSDGQSRSRARRHAALGLTTAVLVGAVGAGDAFGALNDSASFRAGSVGVAWESSESSRERYAWVRGAVEQIGPTDSVVASNSMGPHVSTRERAYHFPDRTEADWLLIRMDDLKARELDLMRTLFRSGDYEAVDRWGDEIVLWRRIAPEPDAQ